MKLTTLSDSKERALFLNPVNSDLTVNTDMVTEVLHAGFDIVCKYNKDVQSLIYSVEAYGYKCFQEYPCTEEEAQFPIFTINSLKEAYAK